MSCPRHGTDCLTDATQLCVYDLIEAHPDGMDQHLVALHFGVDHTRIGQIERAVAKKLRCRMSVTLKPYVDPIDPSFGMPVRRYGAAQ